MADTGSTWLTEIDETEPDGATKTVSVLDDHQRRFRSATKNTIQQEHALGTGRHADVVRLGADTATTKRLIAQVLVANKPEIRYNIATSLWELSNDGVAFINMAPVLARGGVARAVFAQAAAPTGWTQTAAYADRVLVFNGGAADGTFGAVNPNNGAATVDVGGEHNHGAATGNTALSTAQLAAHRHGFQTVGTAAPGGDVGWHDQDGINPAGVYDTDGTGTANNNSEPADVGSGSTHNHTVPGSGTHGHNYNYDFSGRYVLAATLD